MKFVFATFDLLNDQSNPTLSQLAVKYILADQIAAELRRRGHSVTFASYQDPMVDWSRYDLAYLHSTWNYVRNLRGFEAWLSRIDSIGNLFNRPSTVLWNVNKRRYMRDLALMGVNLIPTVFVPQHNQISLEQICIENGLVGGAVVFKPAVGCAGQFCHKVDISAPIEWSTEAKFVESCRQGGVLLQKFIGEVQVEGEFSLIFLGGKFSHSVLKRPAQGDFKSQSFYGGSVEPAKLPPDSILRMAQTAVASLPEPPLYARVDLVRNSADIPFLMELELIEPELFWEFADKSAVDLMVNLMVAEAKAIQLANGSRKDMKMSRRNRFASYS